MRRLQQLWAALPQPQPSIPSRPRQHLRGRRRAVTTCGSAPPALACNILEFHGLLSSGTVEPDCLTFPSLFKTCRAAEGPQLHAQAVKRGFETDAFVQRSLLRMYAKFLACDDAIRVFERCSSRDVVSCNDLIVGLCRTGDLDGARWVFDGMAYRNVVSWSVLVDGYARNGMPEIAQELFDAMPDRNQFSWNSLILGYMRCGRVAVARKIFDRRRNHWDVITWTAMISGYVRNSMYKDALDLFFEMQLAGVLPNKVTVISVLPAVTELGALSQGRRIHAYLEKTAIEIDSILGSALVDMYSSCGCVGEALSVFEKLKHKELSAWNSIISGLAAHGCGSDALHLFDRMQDEFKIAPNDITFTAILSACRYAGLLEEGQRMFHLFTDHYKLKPNIRHYGCMVDLFARAGFLKEALYFIETMPMKPNSVILKSLINACRIHKNIELSDHIWAKIVELGPQDSGFYTLIANIFNDVGKSEDAGKVRKKMNDLQVKKVAGCSWIELNGVIHEFLMDRASFHSQGMEILCVLHEMEELMKLEEFNLDDSSLLNNKEDKL